MEALARARAQADRLAEASAWLMSRAVAFEAADAATGLWNEVESRLRASGREIGLPWIFTAPLFQWLLQDTDPPPGGDDETPWWAPLALELSKAWNWYHQNVNQRIYDSVETWQGIGENGRQIALYYSAQLWFGYDRLVNQPIYDSVRTWQGIADNARAIVLISLARAWFGYDRAVNQPIYRAVEVLPERAENLNRRQGPGPDPNGPIGPSLAALATTDAAGTPVSLVGSEVATLIEGRGVDVTFLDVGFGVVPLAGRVVFPEYMADAAPPMPWGPGFAAHELTHVLERDLNDPAYWPNGGPSLDGGRFVGDSTNYMEVVSNIVGLTVEYDVRFHVNPNDPGLPDLLDELATYTDADALNATRYLVSDSWDAAHPDANAIYRANYAHELTVTDHRIPAGGWDSWLKQMGFSNAAVQHIQDLASQGTAEYIDPASLDPQTGLPITPTATPTATPTSTPTPTASPAPTLTPTSTPSATATPSPTSSPNPSATPSNPSATPTPNP